MIFSKPFYYIRDVKDHASKKKEILWRTSQNNYRYSHNESKDALQTNDFISNTDYVLDNADWFEYALSKKDQLAYGTFLHNKFQQDLWGVTVAWFQQYDKNSGSQHGWHNHIAPDNRIPDNLTNIYYVELEDKSLRTILKHPKTGKEIIPRVKEGQMLSFDAKIMHKSPPNYTNTRKTIISFNIRFLQ